MAIAIRKHRISAGIKQTELARALGYRSSSTITMWESGERRPPSDKLPEIARIFGCKIDDLFDGKDGIGEDMQS